MHLQHLIPRWQDGDKHRRLKTIMSDRPDLIVSEMGGVAFSSVDQCFRFCDLKRMFDMPVPMSLEWNTPFFVCIDPCAGGEHSDFALVSFVYVHGAYQVLGADVLQTKEPEKTFQLLRDHVDAVRRTHSMLLYSTVRIIIENNLGFEGQHLYRECKSIDNSRFVCEPGKMTRVGVHTTHELKLAFVVYTNVLLRETRVFAHPEESWVEVNSNGTRKILQEQLNYFGFVFSKPDNIFQKERVQVSGKSAGGKDDLAMALLISLYFSIDSRYVLI